MPAAAQSCPVLGLARRYCDPVAPSRWRQGRRRARRHQTMANLADRAQKTLSCPPGSSIGAIGIAAQAAAVSQHIAALIGSRSKGRGQLV